MHTFRWLKLFVWLGVLCLAVACGGDDGGRANPPPPPPPVEAGMADTSMMDADIGEGGMTDDATMSSDGFVGRDGGPFSCVLEDLLPFTLAVDSENQSRIISVSADDLGFLIVWSAFDMETARRNIYARRIPLSGDATETVMITDDVWTNDSPSVAHVGGGNRLAAWYDNAECETAGDGDSCDFEVFVSQVGANGSPTGSRTKLTENILRDDEPVLLGVEGGALAVWVQDDDFSRQARSVMLSSAGIPRGGSSLITTDMNSLTTPVLARMGEGFAMAWAESRAESQRMVVMPLDSMGIYGNRGA